MVGQTISHYKITEKLGEGGMGVVYKAEDTKLERTVALKFLAGHLLNDDEAKARFLREAKAAAGLHHANICPVHEIGEANGKTFLSMAFIEGEPVEARIANGPLPLKEALDIAHQMADGLDAAHDKGVVHRDIKPANVMADAKGHVTIMDFGLALLTEASRLTKIDQTMGTVAYMSPEQAQGMEVDHRSDIWALGVVLYEMVRGGRPFQGEYDQALLFEIVNQEPEPLTGVRAGVPMELEFIVGKCLAKDPQDRYQRAGDAVVDLRSCAEKLKSGRSTTFRAGTVGTTQVTGATAGTQAATDSLAGPEHAGTVPIKRKVELPWVIATLAIAIAVVLAWVQFSRTPPDYEFTVSLPEGSRLHTLSASPDGHHLAIAVRGGESNSPLLVRSLDSVELRELAGTEGAGYPFWSPDSRYIGFFAQGKLKKIALAGGPAQSLCDAPVGRGGSWNEDGRIIFAPNPYGGFQYVSAGGGEPVPLKTGDPSQAQISRRFPHFLPDGRHFLYLDRSPRGNDESGIFLGSIDGQPPRRLLSDQSNVIYVPGAPMDEGFILFVREGSLMAQPFDAAGLEFAGDIFPVVEAVGRVANSNNHGFSASNSGTVVYAGEGAESQAQLAWFSREGSEIDRIGEPRPIRTFDLSPDEQKVALSVRADSTADIWVYELARGTMSRFTSDPQTDFFPAWSPDGAFIAFASDREGTFTIYQKSAGGAGEAQALLTPEQRGLASYGSAWSQDGRFLLYSVSGPNTSIDIWVLPLDGKQEPFPFLATEFRESAGQFSGDAVGRLSCESIRSIRSLYPPVPQG